MFVSAAHFFDFRIEHVKRINQSWFSNCYACWMPKLPILVATPTINILTVLFANYATSKVLPTTDLNNAHAFQKLY